MRICLHQAGGKTWHGNWRVVGKEVCVWSAYGGGRVAIGRRRDHQKLADELFRDILRAWVSGDATYRQT